MNILDKLLKETHTYQEFEEWAIGQKWHKVKTTALSDGAGTSRVLVTWAAPNGNVYYCHVYGDSSWHIEPVQS